MIGNVVQYSGSTFKVTDIDSAWPRLDDRYNNKPVVTLFDGGILSVCLDEIIPILITEDFLTRNGFELDEKIYEDFEDKYYELKLEKFSITIHEGSNTIGRDWWVHIDSEDCCSIASADIQYVHHLQNLLNIMNIQFDIKL